MRLNHLFAWLLAFELLSFVSLKAQGSSDDGRTYVTNSDGQVSLWGSQEEWVWSEVYTALERGYVTNALNICNQVLEKNPKQRWAKLARMEVWEKLGETAKAEQDFDYLTRDYPNFLQAYNGRAIMLLQQPMPQSGTPPIVDWLNSSDEHKRTAANDLVTRILKILSDNESELLNSPDKETQRKTLESLQLAWNLIQRKVDQRQRQVQHPDVHLTTSLTNSVGTNIVVEAGGTITLRTVINNSSTNAIFFREARNFDVLLIDVSGKQRSLTSKPAEISMNRFFVINPSEQSVRLTPVTIKRDVEAGEYTIRVHLWVSSSEGDLIDSGVQYVFMSNELKVRVK